MTNDGGVQTSQAGRQSGTGSLPVKNRLLAMCGRK